MIGSGAFATVSRPLTANDDKSPLMVFPHLWEMLTREAGKRVAELRPNHEVLLEAAGSGVYAESLVTEGAQRPLGKTLLLAPDGLLVFAVDVTSPLYVQGTLVLTPDADVRPGLRATVHCDDRLIAAPMVSAPAWGSDQVTDPAPLAQGNLPSVTVPLSRFLLPKGRHYLSVGGPAFRPGGEFKSLTLTALPQPVETPVFTFAFLSDTHVRREGRPEWMNLKMGDATPTAFRDTLRQLATEGVDFVQHGGDMTEGGVRDEFVLFSHLLKDQPLPFYGCIGNHDAYHATSRPDALETLAAHFPGGTLDYAHTRKPLRFVVLDENITQPEHTAAKLDWLRRTLKADPSPTILVWHYAAYNRAGLSQCGFRMQDWGQFGRENILGVLADAPHVFATLNGHNHWDEVNVHGGITHIQNAAFVEWPNTYRVFRVYTNRVEWETRQAANRGFVRESFLPQKALSWMICTRDSDLTGEVRFSGSRDP